MTAKTPVYWRTKDGRKVVILYRSMEDKTSKIMCYSADDAGFRYYYDDELTEWKELVAKTVWFNLWNDGSVTISDHKIKALPYVTELLAQKKITITEGEFDE